MWIKSSWCFIHHLFSPNWTQTQHVAPPSPVENGWGQSGPLNTSLRITSNLSEPRGPLRAPATPGPNGDTMTGEHTGTGYQHPPSQPKLRTLVCFRAEDPSWEFPLSGCSSRSHKVNTSPKTGLVLHLWPPRFTASHWNDAEISCETKQSWDESRKTKKPSTNHGTKLRRTEAVLIFPERSCVLVMFSRRDKLITDNWWHTYRMIYCNLFINKGYTCK